jgi:hypothetical protein
MAASWAISRVRGEARGAVRGIAADHPHTTILAREMTESEKDVKCGTAGMACASP